MSALDAAAPAIRVSRAIKDFGELRAVNDVSFDVAHGEVVGLLGANGAGKTTLMRMVLGLLRPDSGEVLLLGEQPGNATRQRLGYLPQGLGLYDDLTVGENLDFVARAFSRGRTTPSDAGVAAAWSEGVAGLPLGLKRRTAFAAALSHDPDVLILDEPTSGVDALARAQLWELIGGAAGRGAGVLVSTHYMEEARNCDRLVVMARGEIVAEGTVPDIVGTRTVTEVRCDDLVALHRVLDRDGINYLAARGAVRLIDMNLSTAESLLRVDHIAARCDEVPATFEESFVQLVASSSA